MKEKWKYEQVQNYQNTSFVKVIIEGDLVSARDAFRDKDYDTAYRLLGGIVTYMELYDEEFR